MKNFDSYRPRRELEPTRKESRLYRAWRTYLKNSKLTSEEQHSRAATAATQGRAVPKD